MDGGLDKDVRLGWLWDRIANPSGIALPVTLFVITIGFALASVGSLAAMSSLRNTTRDESSKEAIAIAEAGLDQALLRQNKILTADGFPCLVLGAAQDLIPGYPLPNGWCPQQSGTVDEGSYTYQVKPATVLGALSGENKITIVSEGTVGETTRRLTVDAYMSTGAPAFAEANVIGLDRFEFTGNAIVNSSAATNADMVLSGNAQVCGDAKHGEGRSLITSANAGLCSGYSSSETRMTLSPPDPGNVFTSNDNGRFFADDTKVGPVTWDPATRTISMTGNSALTLGGANYGVCRLLMSANSNVYIASGAVTRIWFDSPENCGLAAGERQLSMTGNSQISVTSGSAGDAGLLFVGSSTTPSTIELAGNGRANELMLYAPLSDVVISRQSAATSGRSPGARSSTRATARSGATRASSTSRSASRPPTSPSGSSSASARSAPTRSRGADRGRQNFIPNGLEGPGRLPEPAYVRQLDTTTYPPIPIPVIRPVPSGRIAFRGRLGPAAGPAPSIIRSDERRPTGRSSARLIRGVTGSGEARCALYGMEAAGDGQGCPPRRPPRGRETRRGPRCPTRPLRAARAPARPEDGPSGRGAGGGVGPTGTRGGPGPRGWTRGNPDRDPGPRRLQQP